MPSASEQLFKKILLQGSFLIGGIALLGGVIGFLIASVAGLISALIGAAMALLFVSMTALSVWLGGKLSLGGFFGVVLGGWIFKLLLFIGLVLLLKGAAFIVGPILFVCIVLSVVGSLALDAIAVLKTRIPTVGN
jgi:hypothetical protein